MLRSRWSYALLQRALVIALLGLVALQTDLRAQTRWTVAPRASLAWWQINPHLNHLWATTCPEEPSWRPGEGRSSGWQINPGLKAPQGGYSATLLDSAYIPLYPRLKVRSICAEAVKGHVSLPDTLNWRGASGEIIVKAEEIVGGDNNRDNYAREAVLTTNRYPVITFRIDSVVNVSRNLDTLRGTAVGTFTLRNVEKPVTAAVQSWPEAGGHRVLGRFHIPAQDLVPEYGISKFALGLGVGVKIWKELWVGVDLLMRPEGTGSGGGMGATSGAVLPEERTAPGN